MGERSVLRWDRVRGFHTEGTGCTEGRGGAVRGQTSCLPYLRRE